MPSHVDEWPPRCPGLGTLEVVGWFRLEHGGINHRDFVGRIAESPFPHSALTVIPRRDQGPEQWLRLGPPQIIALELRLCLQNLP